MYSLIRKWEGGDLTQQQFNHKHGISKSAFSYWRKKYLKESGKKEKRENFIPVKISDGPSNGCTTRAIELVYPNGVRLICSSGMDLARLKPLIVL